MRKLNLIIIATFFVLVAADCGNKNNNPTYYMPKDFKEYVVFPQGSYWIYEDSISGIFDSIYLETQTTQILEPPSYNNWGYKYEYLKEMVYSAHNNQLSMRTGRFNEYQSNNENGSYIYYGLHPLFISNIPVGSGCENLKYIQHLDSLLINNICYKDIKIFASISSIGNVDYIKTFFCRNIGLVKMEISDNTDTTGLKIWLLKSYHISN